MSRSKCPRRRIATAVRPGSRKCWVASRIVIPGWRDSGGAQGACPRILWIHACARNSSHRRLPHSLHPKGSCSHTTRSDAGSGKIRRVVDHALAAESVRSRSCAATRSSIVWESKTVDSDRSSSSPTGRFFRRSGSPAQSGSPRMCATQFACTGSHQSRFTFLRSRAPPSTANAVRRESARSSARRGAWREVPPSASTSRPASRHSSTACT